MLVIQAGLMVIHSEINYRKKEQSLAEVQKTIALYDFALVSYSWLAIERKSGILLSMLVSPAIRNN